ncbi:uncharacterized protein [Macaca nemestrina]|uniref:uncharacterized protein n=1 Tax=Macaca nemestrina TaxID=9545 RepID=UPI0039B92ED7
MVEEGVTPSILRAWCTNRAHGRVVYEKASGEQGDSEIIWKGGVSARGAQTVAASSSFLQWPHRAHPSSAPGSPVSGEGLHRAARARRRRKEPCATARRSERGGCSAGGRGKTRKDGSRAEWEKSGSSRSSRSGERFRGAAPVTRTDAAELPGLPSAPAGRPPSEPDSGVEDAMARRHESVTRRMWTWAPGLLMATVVFWGHQGNGQGQVLTRIETENSSKGRCGIREQGPKMEPSYHEVGEQKHSSLKHPCSSACPISPFPNKSRFLNRREATLNKEYIRTLHNSYNLQTSSQVYWSENTW